MLVCILPSRRGIEERTERSTGRRDERIPQSTVIEKDDNVNHRKIWRETISQGKREAVLQETIGWVSMKPRTQNNIYYRISRRLKDNPGYWMVLLMTGKENEQRGGGVKKMGLSVLKCCLRGVSVEGYLAETSIKGKWTLGPKITKITPLAL